MFKAFIKRVFEEPEPNYKWNGCANLDVGVLADTTSRWNGEGEV